MGRKIIVFGAACLLAAVAAIATWYFGFYLPKAADREALMDHPSVSESLPGGIEGISTGSAFGITELSAKETPNDDAETNLQLRIGVEKRPNTAVDSTKVRIQVFFYDTVDEKDIRLTDANLNYEWLTPKHDWAQTNPEVLAVTYVRPKDKLASQETVLIDAA